MTPPIANTLPYNEVFPAMIESLTNLGAQRLVLDLQAMARLSQQLTVPEMVQEQLRNTQLLLEKFNEASVTKTMLEAAMAETRVVKEKLWEVEKERNDLKAQLEKANSKADRLGVELKKAKDSEEARLREERELRKKQIAWMKEKFESNKRIRKENEKNKKINDGIQEQLTRREKKRSKSPILEEEQNPRVGDDEKNDLLSSDCREAGSSTAENPDVVPGKVPLNASDASVIFEAAVQLAMLVVLLLEDKIDFGDISENNNIRFDTQLIDDAEITNAGLEKANEQADIRGLETDIDWWKDHLRREDQTSANAMRNLKLAESNQRLKEENEKLKKLNEGYNRAQPARRDKKRSRGKSPMLEEVTGNSSRVSTPFLQIHRDHDYLKEQNPHISQVGKKPRLGDDEKNDLLSPDCREAGSSTAENPVVVPGEVPMCAIPSLAGLAAAVNDFGLTVESFVQQKDNIRFDTQRIDDAAIINAGLEPEHDDDDLD